ncbi:Ral GTPase-activating protein subunit alpha-2 [Clydaea vesicula]|uniref:Ral GTPase-activating protein subunit alpha-2 n=1 Tax=Clydaea vesicula TaxID=447962 RepID=A0AAD5U4N4_9FUNG|nr:Ral GTPase-activating protein subunit alpha-2 [Clydaea vesicula]
MSNANKSNKKLKGFFDEKLKPKQRLQVLYSFLENATEQEQTSVFIDYHQLIYTIAVDIFGSHIEKTKVKDKSQRPMTPGGKEFLSIVKLNFIFIKLLHFNVERTKQGWQNLGFVTIAQILLASNNHPRLRFEGIKILVALLSNLQEESFSQLLKQSQFEELDKKMEGAISLFNNCIFLFVFNSFELPETARDEIFCEFQSGSKFSSWYGEGNKVKLKQIPIEGGKLINSNGPTISGDRSSVMIPTELSGEDDSIEMIEEVLHNVLRLCGLAAIKESACDIKIRPVSVLPPSSPSKRMSIQNQIPLSESPLSSNTTNYSDVLSSSTNNSIKCAAALNSSTGQSAIFSWELFKKFYLRILFPMTSRRVGLLIADGEGFVACKFDYLKIYAGANHSLNISEENREFFHEMIRQCMLLPYSESETIKGAVHLMRYWITSPIDERPAFLQEVGFTNSGVFDKNSRVVISSQEEVVMNLWARRYIKLLKLVFVERNTFSSNYQVDTPNQIIIYKEVLQIFRLIAMEIYFMIQSLTWKVLLTNLLEIQEIVMCPRLDSSGNSGKLSQKLDLYEINENIMEALLCTWVRSLTVDKELWKKLRSQLTRSVFWPQCVAQWAKTMYKLTKIIASQVYNIDYDNVFKTDTETFGSKRHKNVLSRFRSPTGVANRSVTLGASGSFMNNLPEICVETENQVTSGENFLSSSNRTSMSPEKLENSFNPNIAKNDFDSEDEDVVSKGFGNVKVAPNVKQLIKDFKGSVSSMGLLGDENSKVETVSPKRIMFSFQVHHKLADFLNLTTLNWNSENAQDMWKNMLCALGNPNSILPSNHSEAIKCLVNVWDTLEKVRTAQSYEKVSMPSFFEFLPWIFQAADLTNDYSDGRAIAYGLLCKMMCRRHDQPIPENAFSHFYRLLIKGLSTDDSKIIIAILMNSTQMFTLCLPGSCITIKAFIKAVERLFVKKSIYPEIVRQNGIKILSSLICILNSDDFKDPDKNTNESNRLDLITVRVSDLEDNSILNNLPELDYTSKLCLKGYMTFETLKLELKDLFLALLSNEEKNKLSDDVYQETQGQIICSIGVMAFEEMINNQEPNKEVVDDCINSLLSHLTSPSLKIMSYTTGTLCFLAENVPKLQYMEEAIIKGIIEKIVGSLNEVLMFPNDIMSKEVRSVIVSRIFYCLLEWIMVASRAVISNTHTSQMLCDVIEYALTQTPAPFNDYASESSDTEKTNNTKKEKKEFIRKHSLIEKKKGNITGMVDILNLLGFGNQIIFSSAMDEFETENVEDGLIQETAENVLEHILHHVNNFSPPYGAALMHSSVMEPAFLDENSKNNGKYLYFTYNDSTLITVIEIPGEIPQETKSRFILRDVTGKYAWDSRLFYESITNIGDSAKQLVETFEDVEETEDFYCQNNVGFVKEIKFKDQIEIKPSVFFKFISEKANYQRDTSTPPFWKEDTGCESIDIISEEHPDCLLEPGRSLNVPCDIRKDRETLIGNVGELLQEHITSEEDYDKHIGNSKDIIGNLEKNVTAAVRTITVSKPNSQNQLLSEESRHCGISTSGRVSSVDKVEKVTHNFVEVSPTKSQQSLPIFQRSRLLMSHLGFLTFGGLKDNCFHLLGKTPALYRDIKGLDKKFGREAIKVAIIYVKAGQEDEASILKNDAGSYEYDQFVKSLGWEIDITTHPGYLGGLEKSLATGKTATYYCTSTIEVIYHETTKMPTDPVDPKQLKKKRHIGNDQVHIIWNEHYRDYKSNTIGGDFGNAQIIVTPLINGLFAIEIYRDSKVRMSAIHAYRASLVLQRSNSNLQKGAGPPIYRPAYSQRAADIKLITSRHKVGKWTYERFLESVFMSWEEKGMDLND